MHIPYSRVDRVQTWRALI